MKIKITRQRLFEEYDPAAARYLKRTNEELGESRNRTKIGYAIYRISTRLQAIYKEYNEKITEIISDLRVDNCELDGAKRILRDERGNYIFTPEAEKRIASELRKRQAVLLAEEVELEVYIATRVDADLWASEVDAFRGIIIPADYGAEHDEIAAAATAD